MADDPTPSQQIKAESGSSIQNVQQIIGDVHEHHHHYPADSAAQALSKSLPPKAYHHLIGRSQEQDTILNALRAPDKRPLLVIVGLGGMGKTALAREVAERCRQEQLFDHLVWISAKTEHFVGERIVRQDEAIYDFDALLSDVARQCDRVDIATMPLGQKKTAVAHLLSQQRILIVLDNLETMPNYDDLVQQVGTILGRGKLLITSRHRISHDQAFTIELRGFPEEDGIAFLRAEGRERNVTAVVTAPINTLLQIQQDTGGAPLALKLVVGQVSRQPMDVVLKALKEASAQGQDYEFYRFIYWHSWNLLDEPGQMALVDMSVFPPVNGGAHADVEAVSQLEASRFWPAIDQLVTMSLVDKTGALGQERYALHPLTHYFILADITEEWADDGEGK
jgi:nucleoside-triphosphatase THEP1